MYWLIQLSIFLEVFPYLFSWIMNSKGCIISRFYGSNFLFNAVSQSHQVLLSSWNFVQTEIIHEFNNQSNV